MSSTATRKIVQPKTTYNYVLDQDRIFISNLRLNNFGRMIISRHHSDNPQLLLTQFGFNWLRDMNAVEVKEVMSKNNSHTFRTVVNRLACERLAQEKFYSLVDLRLYDDFVAKMYSKPEAISFRSVFTAEKYFEKLNEYGHNRFFKLDSMLVNKMLGFMDKLFTRWINDPAFNFDLEGFLKTGKWLTHIKTNSNSGYPDNVKQDKEMMSRYAGIALDVFNDYVSGKNINWFRLPFEMGYRTERKGKHRVICMAPTIEKVLSSVLSTVLDSSAASLPFNLPRKFGGPDMQIRELMNVKGNVISKDFDAYDTSIPLHIFSTLLAWFKKFDNTVSKIIQFELDLIIHSYMVVGANKVFWIASLPSGIGVTQFIGSLIHWLLDLCFDINYNFVMYQSDDNIGRTDLSLEELNIRVKNLQKQTGMEVSPYGEKSLFHAHIGRFLQKVMDVSTGVYYNHEQRAYTNGIFRERQISDDTVFNLLFETNNKDVEHKKMVLAYLGNIVSYGVKAPSLANILSFLYGKRSGFTAKQVEWGLSNLQKYMVEYLSVEEHRPLDSAGWTEGFFNKAMEQFGWSSISNKEAALVLGSL